MELYVFSRVKVSEIQSIKKQQQQHNFKHPEKCLGVYQQFKRYPGQTGYP